MLNNWKFGAKPVDTLPNPSENDSRDIRVSALGLCQQSKAFHLFWVGPFQCKTSLFLSCYNAYLMAIYGAWKLKLKLWIKVRISNAHGDFEGIKILLVQLQEDFFPSANGL